MFLKVSSCSSMIAVPLPFVPILYSAWYPWRLCSICLVTSCTRSISISYVCKKISIIAIFVGEVKPFMFNVAILIVSICYHVGVMSWLGLCGGGGVGLWYRVLSGRWVGLWGVVQAWELDYFVIAILLCLSLVVFYFDVVLFVSRSRYIVLVS
jgi:hypothetical protein